NKRLSLAVAPGSPSCPGNRSRIASHCSSEISWRRNMASSLPIECERQCHHGGGRIQSYGVAKTSKHADTISSTKNLPKLGRVQRSRKPQKPKAPTAIHPRFGRLP